MCPPRRACLASHPSAGFYFTRSELGVANPDGSRPSFCATQYTLGTEKRKSNIITFGHEVVQSPLASSLHRVSATHASAVVVICVWFTQNPFSCRMHPSLVLHELQPSVPAAPGATRFVPAAPGATLIGCVTYDQNHDACVTLQCGAFYGHPRVGHSSNIDSRVKGAYSEYHLRCRRTKGNCNALQTNLAR